MKLAEIYGHIKRRYPNEELVFGEGPQNARIMLAGEAPGKDEVRERRPFCGKAGGNLNGFLSAAGLPREDVFITNVCKFRPCKVGPGGGVSNRPPTRGEVKAGQGFLYEEIASVRPAVLVTLGNTPLRAVLDDFGAVIGDYHGRAVGVTIRGRRLPLFALYHPASVIYNPALRAACEEDFRALRLFLDGQPDAAGR
jgi:DNA polymerase